jgi:hypothetical protein
MCVWQLHKSLTNVLKRVEKHMPKNVSSTLSLSFRRPVLSWLRAHNFFLLLLLLFFSLVLSLCFPSLQPSMIVVVWRQIQATFLARFDRFEKLVGDCYSNEKLTTTHEEIVELFTQILPAAAAGGGAGGAAPAAAKNYVSHDNKQI